MERAAATSGRPKTIGYFEQTDVAWLFTSSPVSQIMLQCSNDIASDALHPLPSASGVTNRDGLMRNVSDTIARLAAFRARLGALAPDGASADRLSVLSDFGSNPGALDARIYLPDAMPDHAPLVVVLHGCTQTAGGYDSMSGWSKLADKAGFALLYPQQSRSNNPNLCFNWFNPEDAARDRGETLSIRQMVEAMIIKHGLDRTRVFVTGLSAGGAMAVSLLSNYPEVFAGGGIIAGLPHGSAKTIPEAFDRMRGHGGPSEQELQRLLARASPHQELWPRLSIWQGSADKTVAPSNADAIAGQWRGVHRLDDTPTHLTTAGHHTKRSWHDQTGNAVLEINTIAGMGHGTPLDDELGAAGPYMLDVGISSTREIARFWGLASTTATATSSVGQRPQRKAEHTGLAHGVNAVRPADAHTPRRDTILHVPANRKIIEDALRAAGLLSNKLKR
jgi:poly(hydroxyalkanoate) depolymerase family esterase